MSESGAPLPVHGFVLAGGRSSRMGQDKALLRFCGVPLVEIAVEKLRDFCAEVWISATRDDLGAFAPMVPDREMGVGPAGGMAAGLEASRSPWALFLPVDVPLVPAALLRRWAEAVLLQERSGVRLSYLQAGGERQPAICLLHTECRPAVESAVSDSIYKLSRVHERVAASVSPHRLWVADAEDLLPAAESDALAPEHWFSNVNTPAELAEAEAQAVASGGDGTHAGR